MKRVVSKLDILLTLGVGAAGIILYYAAFFAMCVRKGRPMLLWIHIVIQALFGGFLGGAATLVRLILKG